MGNSMGINEGRGSEKREKRNVQVCIAKSAHKQSLGKGCISSPFSLHTRQKNDWSWCICLCAQSLIVHIALHHSLQTKIQLQLSLPPASPSVPPVLKFPADSVAFSRPLSIITVLQTSSLYQTCKTGAPPTHMERKACSDSVHLCGARSFSFSQASRNLLGGRTLSQGTGRLQRSFYGESSSMVARSPLTPRECMCGAQGILRSGSQEADVHGSGKKLVCTLSEWK